MPVCFLFRLFYLPYYRLLVPKNASPTYDMRVNLKYLFIFKKTNPSACNKEVVFIYY